MTRIGTFGFQLRKLTDKTKRLSDTCTVSKERSLWYRFPPIHVGTKVESKLSPSLGRGPTEYGRFGQNYFSLRSFSQKKDPEKVLDTIKPLLVLSHET